MTTTDGRSENNAGRNYFSMAARRTVHPAHKKAPPALTLTGLFY